MKKFSDSLTRPKSSNAVTDPGRRTAYPHPIKLAGLIKAGMLPRGNRGRTEMNFTQCGLDKAGFSDWMPVENIKKFDCWPEGPGVYIVRYRRSEPCFSERSCGGWFKGRDPSVPTESLTANWVTGAEIVYIGKANKLRRRLRELIRFGQGHAIGHWGGRLMWQLESPSDLEVAWLETPDRDPREVESELITAFRAQTGQPPFANDPHKLGR